jgi:hypothetical protein
MWITHTELEAINWDVTFFDVDKIRSMIRVRDGRQELSSPVSCIRVDTNSDLDFCCTMKCGKSSYFAVRLQVADKTKYITLLTIFGETA